MTETRSYTSITGSNVLQGALPGKAKTPTAAPKTGRPVTLKHLAGALAEEHQLTKRAGEDILGDLVSLITKHLRKGERIALPVSAS